MKKMTPDERFWYVVFAKIPGFWRVERYIMLLHRLKTNELRLDTLEELNIKLKILESFEDVQHHIDNHIVHPRTGSMLPESNQGGNRRSD